MKELLDFAISEWAVISQAIPEFLGVSLFSAFVGFGIHRSLTKEKMDSVREQKHALDERMKLSQSDASAPKEVTVAANNELPVFPNSGELYNRLRAEVENAVRSMPDNQRIERLKDAAAFEIMERHFALTYANIYGSQIRALTRLNSLPDRSISMTDAQEEYQKLQSESEFYKGLEFNAFLRFLEITKLICIENGLLRLTDTGKNFLIFVTKYELNLDRPN